jgi:hypothetical protein
MYSFFDRGFFKCCISPLIAEQYEAGHPRAFIRTEPNGERVIVDPGITYSRVYMRYYLLINVGALVGQVSMGKTRICEPDNAMINVQYSLRGEICRLLAFFYIADHPLHLMPTSDGYSQ